MPETPDARRAPLHVPPERGVEGQRFAEHLRAARLRAQLSQEALAERAGISARSVRYVEGGHVRSPHPDTVRRLGNALGLDGQELQDFLLRARGTYWTRRAAREGRSPAPGGTSPEPEAREAGIGPPDAAIREADPPALVTTDPVPLRLLGPVRLHVPTPHHVPGRSGTTGGDGTVPGQGLIPGGRTDTLSTSGQARAVLACLALRITSFVPVDQLVDEVWGERPPPSAPKTLRGHVTALRRVLECSPGRSGSPMAITSEAGGFRMVGRREQVDWYLFEEMVAQGRALARRGEHPAARSLFVTALDLWRGPGMADVPEVPIRALFVPVMEASRRAALADRIDADLAMGGAHLVDELRALYARTPEDQRLLAQLVRALTQAGRQEEALALSTGTCRAARADGATGAPPQRVAGGLGGTTGGLGGTTGGAGAGAGGLGGTTGGAEPAVVGARGGPTPRWAGSFVGRARELQELEELCTRHRLITLVGPPGVGKSRLAWEAMNRLRSAREDNAWVVGLGEITDVASVSQTIVAALGATGSPHRDPFDLLKSHLLGREALLVLDDCERLLAQCADLVVELLASRPLLRVLVTSREPLAIPEETVYRVDPLPVPAAEAVPGEELARVPSVELFCDRARAVHPFFTLTDDVAPTIAAVCRAVDGLPLALELASARIGVLSGGELAERLDDQLSLLSRPSTRALRRHGSLRAAMVGSHALLDPAEADLFARLAVFPGAFTLTAAEAVGAEAPSRVPAQDPGAPQVLDLVHALVNKSLLLPDVTGEPTRYRMLEPVRQYAASLLDGATSEDARRRRARHVLTTARRAAQERRGPRRARWTRVLDAEQATITATLHAALGAAPQGAGWDTLPQGTTRDGMVGTTPDAAAGADLDTALELASLLWWRWATAPREGLGWYRRVLAATRDTASPVDPRHHLDALLSAAVIASVVSPHEAMDYAERARVAATQLGDVLSSVRALQHISDVALELGDLPLAHRTGREALDLAEPLGGYAVARCRLTVAYNHLADLEIDEAGRWVRRAAAAFEQIDDEQGGADCDLAAAELASLEGRGEAVVPRLTRALATQRRYDNQESTARAATLLATLLARAGERETCLDLVREACDLHLAVRNRWCAAHDLDRVASIAATWGDHAAAVTLLAAAESLRAEADLRGTPLDRAVRSPVAEVGRAALGEHGFRVSHRNGAGADLSSALAVARSLAPR